jgi:hypothetical protein
LCVHGEKEGGPERASAYSLVEYRNWKHEGAGRTATITFHHKHWFDRHISIQYLEYLLEEYPRGKIGLIWDAFSAHDDPLVKAWLEEHKDRIVAVGITGGLTSVLQVCDLTCNKDLKAFIRNGYYSWRTTFIKAAKEKLKQEGKSEHDAWLTIKIGIAEMTNIVEAAVKEYNEKQRASESIRLTFRKVNQDPWKDCKSEFKAHLDSLQEDAMYRRIIDNQTATELD